MVSLLINQSPDNLKKRGSKHPESMESVWLTIPEPESSGVPSKSFPISTMFRCLLSSIVAVVINTERTIAGVQSLCCFLISAAMPATCGYAIDVPDMMLKGNC